MVRNGPFWSNAEHPERKEEQCAENFRLGEPRTQNRTIAGIWMGKADGVLARNEERVIGNWRKGSRYKAAENVAECVHARVFHGGQTLPATRAERRLKLSVRQASKVLQSSS